MFALSPIATAPSSLAVPPSVLATAASDLVSTRVNPVAVAAPLANTQVANNANNTAPIPSPAAEAPAPAAVNSGVLGNVDATLNATGPSSPFLAQLISQSTSADEDSQIALTASYARFAPAPSYTTLIGYGIVKYRPSNAGLPSAYAPIASDAAEIDNAPVTPAATAYSLTQSRNQSNPAIPNLNSSWRADG